MYLFVFFLLTTDYFSCHSQLDDRIIKGIEFYDRHPLVNWDGTQANFDVSYKIFRYGDLRLYNYSYRYDSLTRDGKIFSRDNFCFFVFHKDSAFGFNYDPDNPFERITRHNVDSLLSNVPIKTFGLERFLNTKPDNVIVSKNGERKEVFRILGTKEDPGDYTVNLYFSPHMNDVEESLSPVLDSSRGMKFFKSFTISEAYYDIKYNMPFPKREGYYGMKRVVIKNEKELLKYFNDYIERSKQ